MELTLVVVAALTISGHCLSGYRRGECKSGHKLYQQTIFLLALVSCILMMYKAHVLQSLIGLVKFMNHAPSRLDHMAYHLLIMLRSTYSAYNVFVYSRFVRHKIQVYIMWGYWAFWSKLLNVPSILH